MEPKYKGKFVNLYVYNRKEEKLQINGVVFQFKTVKKKIRLRN